MTRRLALIVVALHILTAAAAIIWVYSSRKYDCFNVGQCVGDVDFWITFGDISFGTFFVSCIALLASTALYSRRVARPSARIYAWSAALLLPPAVLSLAFWLVNLGVRVIPA